MKTAFILDTCIAVVQIGGLLLLAFHGKLTANTTYMMVGAASALITVSWLLKERKNFSVQISRIISDFWRNWSLGKWIFAGTMTLLVSRQLYPWFLTGFKGKVK